MANQAFDAGWRLALLIRNSIRRYGVEAMLRPFVRDGHISHVDPADQDAVRGRRRPQFDILLAGAADLDSADCRDAVRDLCTRGPRLLVLVDGPEAFDAPWLATCGAQGFLDWSELEPRTLAEAVADVMGGKFSVSAGLAQPLVIRAAQAAPGGAAHWSPSPAALTPRELEVLRLLAEGLSNKQVSRRLQISEHGVKRLVGNVLAKLNCPNRTLAVVRAMEDGLLAA